MGKCMLRRRRQRYPLIVSDYRCPDLVDREDLEPNESDSAYSALERASGELLRGTWLTSVGTVDLNEPERAEGQRRDAR
jgi:hypothetical protein